MIESNLSQPDGGSGAGAPGRRPAMGVFLPTMTGRGRELPDVVAAARSAEELGYESVWAVDQLVAGTGVPFLDATVTLSAAAGATSTIGLGFGVLVLPLHHPVWAAKQVASLQHLSGGRVLLGLGAGGDRHDLAWLAAGVPKAERGRRMDAGLDVLPDLLAGHTVDTGTGAVQLAPAVVLPPLLIGGAAPAALRRAGARADGWLSLPVGPEQLAGMWQQVVDAALAAGRSAPSLTASMVVAVAGDADLPDRDGLARILTDPDGVYGMPAEAVDDILVLGGQEEIMARVDALAAIGAERIVVTLVAGDWRRQAELLAAAVGLSRKAAQSEGKVRRHSSQVTRSSAPIGPAPSPP